MLNGCQCANCLTFSFRINCLVHFVHQFLLFYVRRWRMDTHIEKWAVEQRQPLHGCTAKQQTNNTSDIGNRLQHIITASAFQSALENRKHIVLLHHWMSFVYIKDMFGIEWKWMFWNQANFFSARVHWKCQIHNFVSLHCQLQSNICKLFQNGTHFFLVPLFGKYLLFTSSWRFF